MTSHIYLAYDRQAMTMQEGGIQAIKTLLLEGHTSVRDDSARNRSLTAVAKRFLDSCDRVTNDEKR